MIFPQLTIHTHTIPLTRPQSSLVVLLIINEGCAGASVGGDGKAERRETTGKSCFQDGGRINGGFSRM